MECISKPQVTPLLKQQDISTQFPSKPSIQIIKKKRKSCSDSESHLIHLSRNGKLNEAVIALDAITQNGDKVKPNTYISLLDSCIHMNSIEKGRLLHARIGTVDDHLNNPFVWTKLVSMYAKCGSLEDARRVFDDMRERRNLFTWSSLIGGYTREQRWREIVDLFFWMMAEGNTLPDEFLLPKILQACANLGDIKTGKLIHSLVFRSGLGLDSSCVHVNNSLLSMYAKCGDLNSARWCFDKMEYKDRVTWNSMISGYCRNGDNEEAIRLFDQMKAEGIAPGLITWNILIASHNQSGNCDLAIQLMKQMKDSHGIASDVFTWTSMISGLTQNNKKQQALELFREMLVAGVEPNGVTIASALTACASLTALNKGRELHSVGIKIGTMGAVLVGNSLIEMYSKCGNLEAARKIFDMILEKDVFSWNSMIGAYTLAGYCSKAYDLFISMKNSGVQPNVVTWNVMISGYIRRGDEDQAMLLFHKMETDGMTKPNTASWNLLISGLLQNGQKDKALGIFRQMQFFCNEPPNSITMLSILPACANLVASKKVKEIHCYTLRRLMLELDISVANSLINTYAKSGDMVSARTIFEKLMFRDVISWNTLMSGYILHGCPDMVLHLFDHMRLEGFKPNKGTLVSIILAYSLSGMVEQGKNVFSHMTKDYQISRSLEHYLAMVDLLGRAGRLEEALEFIKDRSLEQDSTVWDALLRACRVHGNIRLAVLAAENLYKIDSRNSSVYRLLLQLYSLHGMSEDVSRMKKHKKRNAVETSPGCSWTEVNNTVHTFKTGARSESPLCTHLDRIQEKIEKTVVPPSYHENKAQLCIEEEAKEEINVVHSEKLATAFALISSSCTSLNGIRIIKNFRICKECHRISKLISLEYGREIYLHDSKGLHHFKNGQCSCRDYW